MLSGAEQGRCSVLNASDSCGCHEKSTSLAATRSSRSSGRGGALSRGGASGPVSRECCTEIDHEEHVQHELKSTQQSPVTLSC